MQNKNNYSRPAGAHKPTVVHKRAAKKKKKSNAYRPKPWLMVIYWIMALLLLVVIYIRIRHFFNVHW